MSSMRKGIQYLFMALKPNSVGKHDGNNLKGILVVIWMESCFYEQFPVLFLSSKRMHMHLHKHICRENILPLVSCYSTDQQLGAVMHKEMQQCSRPQKARKTQTRQGYWQNILVRNTESKH